MKVDKNAFHFNISVIILCVCMDDQANREEVYILSEIISTIYKFENLQNL